MYTIEEISKRIKNSKTLHDNEIRKIFNSKEQSIALKNAMDIYNKTKDSDRKILGDFIKWGDISNERKSS